MTYNLPVMRDLLKWAESGGDENARLDMSYWYMPGNAGASCGTTLCMGGYVVAQAGASFVKYWDGAQDLWLQCEWNDVRHSIRDAATSITGLTSDESDALFTEEIEGHGPQVWAERSIALLRELIQRAEVGLDNHMDSDEVYAWIEDWNSENLDS